MGRSGDRTLFLSREESRAQSKDGRREESQGRFRGGGSKVCCT